MDNRQIFCNELLFIVEVENWLKERRNPIVTLYYKASICYSYAALANLYGDPKEYKKRNDEGKGFHARADRLLRLEKEGKDINQKGVKPEWILQAKDYPIGYILESNGFVVKMKKTKCPYHNEKTASFTINKDNTFHCFGCQKHGDSIELYMHLNKATFPQAVLALID